MFLQEHLELLVKTLAPVMGGLPLNVANRVRDTGDADAECAVTFLPTKIPMVGERLVNPFRGIAFQELDGFRDRKRRRNRNERMNVVFNAADGNRLHLIFPRDTADVRPKTLLQLRSDKFAALLCAENAMQVTTGERMHVLAFLSSLAGLGLFLRMNPSDKSLGNCLPSLTGLDPFTLRTHR